MDRTRYRSRSNGRLEFGIDYHGIRELSALSPGSTVPVTRPPRRFGGSKVFFRLEPIVTSNGTS
jgi:hypothetical protein